MNRIVIQDYESYLGYRVGFIEPLNMPQMFDVKCTEDILFVLFGKPSPQKDYLFYQWMWEIKPHWCENCGLPLKNYSSVYISHIKSRGAYTELRYNPLNINILCGNCHNKWEFSSEEIKSKMYVYQLNKIRGLI